MGGAKDDAIIFPYHPHYDITLVSFVMFLKNLQEIAVTLYSGVTQHSSHATPIAA